MPSSWPFIEGTTNIDQCPTNEIICFEDFHGLLWKSEKSTSEGPTHLINLSSFEVRTMDSIAEDPDFPHSVVPLGSEWLLERGGPQCRATSDLSQAKPGDLISDDRGLSLIVTHNDKLQAFGLLAIDGKRRNVPQDGMIFSAWSFVLMSPDGRSQARIDHP